MQGNPGARWIIGLSLSAALATAAAQSLPEPGSTVYRCGPDGRSYSDAPCPQGRAVTADDSRSPAQQREAREVAQRERQLADRLAAERVKREKANVPAPAVHIGGPASAPAKASGKKPKKSDKKKPGAKAGKNNAQKSKDPTLSDPILTPKK